MHICFDGNNYYTINGGVPDVGKISAYSKEGKLIKSYPLQLDMRGIMYNNKTKSLYINTVDKNIYRIIDLSAGTYELISEKIYENKQSSLAFCTKGKNLFVFDQGTLSIYNFKKGKLIRTLSGLKCGKGNRKGGATIAVDEKQNIYTWDSESQTIYCYNKEGMFRKSFQLSQGNFGYSLSFANGMLFVAQTEQDKPGKWFGYRLTGV